MKEGIPNIYSAGTQLHSVIEALKAFPNGTDGRFFLKSYIPEYRSRINEARRDGYIIRRDRKPGDRFVKFKLEGYSPLFAVNQ